MPYKIMQDQKWHYKTTIGRSRLWNHDFLLNWEQFSLRTFFVPFVTFFFNKEKEIRFGTSFNWFGKKFVRKHFKFPLKHFCSLFPANKKKNNKNNYNEAPYRPLSFARGKKSSFSKLWNIFEFLTYDDGV